MMVVVVVMMVMPPPAPVIVMMMVVVMVVIASTPSPLRHLHIWLGFRLGARARRDEFVRRAQKRPGVGDRPQ